MIGLASQKRGAVLTASIQNLALSLAKELTQSHTKVLYFEDSEPLSSLEDLVRKIIENTMIELQPAHEKSCYLLWSRLLYAVTNHFLGTPDGCFRFSNPSPDIIQALAGQDFDVLDVRMNVTSHF